MCIVFCNETRIEVARHKFRMRQQSRLKWNVGTDAANHKAIECLAHFGNGIVAIGAMHNELGNHRIVEHGNFAAILHACVYAHTQQVLRVRLKHGLHRRLKAHQSTRRRQEVAEGIFGVDAALNGPTIAFHIGLRDGQFFAMGHTYHHLHQIDARDGFGHRVLYLQARVHL